MERVLRNILMSRHVFIVHGWLRFSMILFRFRLGLFFMVFRGQEKRLVIAINWPAGVSREAVS